MVYLQPQMMAPVSSGQHAMTWKVGCMPEQGIDLTSPTEAVKWILVDSDGPTVVEFTSPRDSSILGVQEHEVRVVVSENFGIDSSSVELHWWVTESMQKRHHHLWNSSARVGRR